MTTTKQTLIAARALISTNARWTQYYPARDANGLACGPEDERAFCFCALGALDRATNSSGDSYDKALDTLQNFMGLRVDVFNDNHTHAEVLAMFDKAIEASE